MQHKQIKIGEPVVKTELALPVRTWTEITCDHSELFGLLGMAPGTTLISMRYSASEVVFTVEEP